MGSDKYFYYIVEADKDGNQFICDIELNRICEYNDTDDCYLLTHEEIKAIKAKLGDKAIILSDEDDIKNEKYNILQISKDGIHDSSCDIGLCLFDVVDYDDIEDDVKFNEDYDSGIFHDYLIEKYGSDDNYQNDLMRRALNETRNYAEFLRTYIARYYKDYEKWWKDNNQ